MDCGYIYTLDSITKRAQVVTPTTNVSELTTIHYAEIRVWDRQGIWR